MTTFEVEYIAFPPGRGPDKYSGLAGLLEAADGDFLKLTFAEIETALGFSLPASAQRYPAWWANTAKGHSHARAWLRHGWHTSQVSVPGQRVTFVRVTSPTDRGSSPRSSSATPSTSGSRGEPPTPAPQAPRAPEKRKDRVGLVGCVKTKLNHAAPADELYISNLFARRKTYVEGSCERWFILSAGYGLVAPGEPIEPYERALKGMPKSAKEAWSRAVMNRLQGQLGSLGGLTFEIHAGKDYFAFGLRDALRKAGARVEIPTEHLRQGEQLAFYGSAGQEASVAALAVSSGDEGSGASPNAPQWLERDAWTALDDLDVSPTLVPACDWPVGVTCLDRPGLYAWWVDEAGAADLSRGLGLTVDPGRIYAGLAGATWWPSGKTTDHTLGRRIGQMHLGGKVRMSTFRWTLASLLFDQLEMRAQASMLITPASEQALTEWMCEQLSVAVHPHDDRDTLAGLEHAVLERLDPPFNLRHMQPTPVRRRLSELRRRISREAV